MKIIIQKVIPPNENMPRHLKIVSETKIDIDDKTIYDIFFDITFHDLLTNEDLLRNIDNCFRVCIDTYFPIYSNKKLDEIKTIIESVVAKYVSN